MAWLAVDKNGVEVIFEYIPNRCNNKEWMQIGYSNYFELPKGSIKKLIGKDLTWDDEPVEIK